MKKLWDWLNHWYIVVSVALFGAPITVILASKWGVSEDEVHTILLAIVSFLLFVSLVFNIILWRRLHR